MRMHYNFPVLDFGAGAEIYYLMGPKGRKGKLVDYGVHHPTETFTADTLPAYVSVGTAADADAYGEELSMGLLAADAGSKSVRTTFRDPDDIDEFADALELYARHRDVRERHGAAGLAYAQTRDWDEINSAVLKVYSRVIEKRERLARMTGR